MITALILLVALAILAWGFYRARPYGKVGIFAWLQSVALMLPWLLFFGLAAAGIYLNIVGVIFLLVASTAVYILLGRQLRAAGQKGALPRRAAAIADAAAEAASEETPAIAQPQEPEPAFTPVPAEDLQKMRGLFGIETFFATETIPYQDGVIFKGNLRGEPAATHERLSSALTEQLGDRYRLFLVENQDQKPVVIVLPSANDPPKGGLAQKVFAVPLFLATVATCLERGGLQLGVDVLSDPQRLQDALPLGLGILAVILLHEVGHWVTARRYKIRLSWPYFIPAWQLGSFGAITRFESLLPNRTVLFDIAFAGPAVGALLSLVMLVVGLLLSIPSGLPQPLPGYFETVPTEFFEGSILVGTLARVILGAELKDTVVNIHPLMAVGWLGLVITALNLLPAGQLDGGRIVQAIYGRRVAARLTVGTLILLAIASLANPLALYWGVLVLFLQRQPERPTLEELTEPNDARAALALLALFLTVMTLFPLTPSLAGRLGIGG
ncbi:site-2 protease family protein [Geitlerinema sp. PCC 7407]|uniref:site-2 protease family protein n=1 Tax=Geitlerinema sp. PCC 7407 TaxID=1173025 RepID=UPI00029FC152|nr:site-2 protease family protein [Geitlerinema sp. PCC 7407]AFY65443.1 peptidase M50 [Geitlerinema sp. PCC 7407]